MIKLTPLQHQKIKDHVLSCYPEEACGICTIDDFIPILNISENPLTSFELNPIDHIKWHDKITCIVHSHTKEVTAQETFDLRTPSNEDWNNQKLSGKPWLIVGCEGEEVSNPIEIPGIPSDNYIGRNFMWYINDCYTLIMDYYKFELGIDLMPPPSEFDWSNNDHLSGFFEQHLEKYGFYEVELNSIQNGDVLILSTLGLYNNHIGVYHDGDIIHQLGISCKQPITTFLNRIDKVVRYGN